MKDPKYYFISLSFVLVTVISLYYFFQRLKNQNSNFENNDSTTNSSEQSTLSLGSISNMLNMVFSDQKTDGEELLYINPNRLNRNQFRSLPSSPN